MVKGIKLSEFQEWIFKYDNLIKTWYIPTFSTDSKWKYFDLHFDTRTMEIYSITARNGENEIKVHVGDDQDDTMTILDLLSIKIK